MGTSVIGIIILAGVFLTCLMERKNVVISIFDWHAAVIVVGGVVGSLFVALDRKSLGSMVHSVVDLFKRSTQSNRQLQKLQEDFKVLREAWRDGRRAQILTLLENSQSLEIKGAGEALLGDESESALVERFAGMRAHVLKQWQPSVEGWDMIARLAPSFGMVGTVTGMVHLFRQMASASSNLGGAMATALLATLYGISIGAAVGGPMSTRMNNELNERMNFIDFLEKSVMAMIHERRAHG